MDKQKILFICVHNSARSQIAEELLKKLGSHKYEAESAGLEPGKLNPFVVSVLGEEGIDIEGKNTRSVADILEKGEKYDYVITVCDEASAEKCPVFPGEGKKLHWGFPDPSGFIGTDEEIISKVRILKERIKKRINQFITENS